MTLTLLFKLLFAHIVCDFPLQTKRMVDAKNSNHLPTKTAALALHSVLHAAAAYVVVWQVEYWYVPLVVLVSHFGIDWWKSSRERNTMSYFVIDQLLHIAVVVALWLAIDRQLDQCMQWASNVAADSRVWMAAIVYIAMWKPASIAISLFIGRWIPDVKSNETKAPQPTHLLTNKESLSLKKAGTWIGYLERTLIVTFVITGHIEAVGFLLAAKSIFRFGDLRAGQETKLTEYVLIGTFSSFFVAVVAGLLLAYC